MSNELAADLRKKASECGDTTVTLPVEIARMIYGVFEEESWEKIPLKDVLTYIADMLEE